MASALVLVVVAVTVPFFILGVLGNIGVLLCIIFTPRLRTRANAIIVSLTSSCLLFLVLVVPFTLDAFLHSEWRVASWYCHAAPYLSFAFIGITVYNIAVLSLYRYFCVVHPVKLCLRSITSIVVMILLSWLIPLTTQTLVAVCRIAHTEYVATYARCVLVKAGEHSTLYNLLVLGGFLPSLGLTLYSYLGIYLRVRSSEKRLRVRVGRTSEPNISAGDAGDSTELRQGDSRPPVPPPQPNRVQDKTAVVQRGPNRGQNCLTKICVVVFVLFMVCYGPIMTLTIIYANRSFPADAYMICTVVYWMGSCLHPLVYATLQPQIRQSFLRLFRCCRKSAPRIPAASSVGAQESIVDTN